MWVLRHGPRLTANNQDPLGEKCRAPRKGARHFFEARTTPVIYFTQMRWKYAVMPILSFMVVAGLVAYAWLHRATLTILSPHGPVAAREASVIGYTVLLCGIVVVPVFVLLFAFAWQYREGGSKRALPHAPEWDHDSWRLELLWWFVPAAIVVALSALAWETSKELDPFKPLANAATPLTIQVVALPWKWLFIYPGQGIATVNTVEFPAGTPVRFLITADAPMNQFWIPSLAGQVMAMPGMTTELTLVASTPGVYPGRSSNISGEGFSGMTFDAHAVTQEEFGAWVAAARQGPRPLSLDSYEELAEPSTGEPIATYATVTPELYAEVVDHAMQSKASALSPGQAPAMTGMTSMAPMPTMSGMSGMAQPSNTPTP